MFKKNLSTLFIVLISIVVGATLLNAKSNVSKKQIITAIKKGTPATKALLKKVPIDYYENDETLLHYAVRFRKQKVVELLVNRKILISRKGGVFYGTALQEAIHYGHLGIASYLIEKGSLLNTRNKYGETALHIAAKNGYLDMVEQLIESGASKSSVDHEGNSPYDLIPSLSWDSRKKLEQALVVQTHEKPQLQSGHVNLGNHRITTKDNQNINVIDKKTKIEDSHMGIDIDVHRVNKF
ncbi:MAG: ankyrin repeat domain-containing protein [Epsilonproteobacteria bacterium]|nr:ankyrin repeat domain-containing protein [Campylobacterota bacterium]